MAGQSEMLPWFRFYHETLDDPKVQGLPGNLFKTWINMLCIAARNGGDIPEADLAFSLRLDEGKINGIVEDLLCRKLLDRDLAGTLRPHNWDGRQFQSDDSKERVKRYRERLKKQPGNGVSNGQGNGDCNGDETADVTAQDTDSDTEQNRAEIDSRGVVEKVSRETCNQAVAEWNQMADAKGLATVMRMTPKRERALPMRLKELGGLKGWREILAKIAASPFLLGDGRDGWRVDFDFVMSPNNLAKVLEGKYDARPGGTNSIQGALGALGRRFRKGGQDS